jgi:hypothetical protein
LKRVACIFIIHLIGLSAFAASQHPDSLILAHIDSLPEDIFQGETVLNLNLSANFDSIIEDASLLRTIVRPARLIVLLHSGMSESIPVQIQTRGNFRLKPENCNFPPLKLSFLKDNRGYSIFKKNSSIKLVNQCQIFQPNFEKYLLQEYLIYKIFSFLSEYSFKVRLLKIKYINEGFLFDTLSRYSFALEPPKVMAKRYNAKRVNSNNVDLDKIDFWQYKLVCFFEYMIMNNDWSMAICHNIELIQPDLEKLPVPIPFDFDWSGIINVPYAVPSASGMKIIQPERSFKGSFKSRRQVRDMIRFFNSKRGEIYALVSQFKELDSSNRIAFLKTLDTYYDILNNYFTFNKEIIHRQ